MGLRLLLLRDASSTQVLAAADSACVAAFPRFDHVPAVEAHNFVDGNQ